MPASCRISSGRSVLKPAKTRQRVILQCMAWRIANSRHCAARLAKSAEDSLHNWRGGNDGRLQREMASAASSDRPRQQSIEAEGRQQLSLSPSPLFSPRHGCNNLVWRGRGQSSPRTPP